MKAVRKKLKKLVSFCKNSFSNELKSILLFGSSVNSIYKAKDVDIIIVLSDDSNKEFVSKKIFEFSHENLGSNSDLFDLPFTEIRENDLFNIIVTRESDIKSKDLKRIFSKDKYLVSFFVPSSLVLLSLKENHRVLFGEDEIKTWEVNIGFFNYVKTLTRSLSLSLFSLLVLFFSISKSFSISCDSLKHLIQNIFILETNMFPRNIDMLFAFYKQTWWVEILMKYRKNIGIKTLDKIKFILTIPIVNIAMFFEAFI